MYSPNHYLSRSVLAKELAELPDNIGRRKAYLALAANWQRLADIATTAITLPRQPLR